MSTLWQGSDSSTNNLTPIKHKKGRKRNEKNGVDKGGGEEGGVRSVGKKGPVLGNRGTIKVLECSVSLN